MEAYLPPTITFIKLVVNNIVNSLLKRQMCRQICEVARRASRSGQHDDLWMDPRLLDPIHPRSLQAVDQK